MFALAETVMMAVDADMVNLYLVETEGEITRYSPDEQSEPRYSTILDLQSIGTSPKLKLKKSKCFSEAECGDRPAHDSVQILNHLGYYLGL